MVCTCRSPRRSSQRDQLRQTPSPGRLDLAAILAQLRRNPGQADGGEHRFFCLAGDPLLVVKDPVLVDFQAMLLAQAADGDVVRLTAGEVVQRRAVAVLGDDPEIDLEAGPQDHRRARGPGGQHVAHLVVSCEPTHDRLAQRRRREDVDVADRLAATPEAAGGDHPTNAGSRFQIGEERADVLRRR